MDFSDSKTLFLIYGALKKRRQQATTMLTTKGE